MSELIDKTADGATSVDDCRGPLIRGWATIAFVILAEGIRDAVDLGLDSAPLQALGAAHYFWHAVIITLSWAVPIAVLVIAVRSAGGSLRDYFAWRRPRTGDVVFAIVAILLLQALGVGLVYVTTGQLGFAADQYRADMAAGMSPWWYVLRTWPAVVYAPFVEESIYRGFLWRGLAPSRGGNFRTLLLTSLLFAGIHWRYYLQGGQFDVPAFVSPFIVGLVLGWIRWRSASTVASMIGHSLSNLCLPVGAILAASL
ncbi:MAG TPA: type II CAAX endopeptidase family protein [Pseudolabrys sp.]|uniref:CPBP family intramembrane glutamic endopeptidase n=1 Tax=Pseudolabrys sp. TaxID=1960880 RepID=UPI002DDCBE32|nr:type II CAAX endopeptidase family protein [Pseudolabrys sp.]HEV2630048.1 type II CAAX endopeptidase family protein [Pseudolabrys sp.]